MISLTLTRTALAVPLAPLVIGTDPAGDLWLDENLGRPQFDWRKKHAPDSDYAEGRVLMSAVLDQAAIPCRIYAQAATTAALDAIQTTLEEALSQFAFTATLTIDGVARAYSAECTWPQWGPVDSGEVRAHLVAASVVIPVNPPGA